MNYHNILHEDMLNGPGLRVVLFVSGCPHNCKGCHNPQTHDFNSGVPFTDAEVEEIEQVLSKPYIQGLTVSGGDPLYARNMTTVIELCDYLKEKYPIKDIWIYTGFKWEELEDIYNCLKSIDVIADGKFIQELADVNIPYVGSSNQRLIDVQKSIKSNKVVLYKVKQ